MKERVIVVVMMSLCMSGVATWRNLGFQEDFVWRWMAAWEASFVVALPLGLAATVIARRIATYKLPGLPSATVLMNAFRLPHA